MNVVTNILRDTVATEEGGTEEDSQGKLTGPQKDREVFKLEFQKSQLYKRGLLGKILGPQATHLQPLSTGHREAHCQQIFATEGSPQQ